MEYSVDKPLVSIITPFFNNGNQMYALISDIAKLNEVEWILIDDGSTDDGPQFVEEVLKRFESLRVSLFKQDNKGVSAARNLGIHYANGRYICFVDSDDRVISSQFNEALVHLAKSMDDVVYCSKFYENRSIQSDFEEKKKLRQSVMFPNQCKVGNGAIGPSPCSKFYRSKLIINHSVVFNEEVYMGEDLLFNLYMIQFGESFGLIKSGFYEVQVGSDSASHSIKYDVYKNFLMFDSELKKSTLNSEYKTKKNHFVISELIRVYRSKCNYSYFRKIVNLFGKYVTVSIPNDTPSLLVPLVKMKFSWMIWIFIKLNDISGKKRGGGNYVL